MLMFSPHLLQSTAETLLIIVEIQNSRHPSKSVVWGVDMILGKLYCYSDVFVRVR